LSSLIDKLVDPVLKRYGVPEWVKPYAIRYVRKNPANTVKFAASFVDIKRKRGEVTKEYVRLPNGLEFKMDHIMHVLNLFFYGEESMMRVAEAWAKSRAEPEPGYVAYFMEMGAADAKHARAVKNLIEGLGRKLEKPQREIIEVFDYVAKLEPWHDRMIATEVVLRDSYAKAFGLVFYKIFYPASPEFMRSFGKAFAEPTAGSAWGAAKAREIIGNKLVPEEHVMEISRGILARILKSIDANMDLAKASGIENEAKLLTDIAIAYPFHTLAELGVEMDIDKEITGVRREAARLKY
jgi:hypothetical protein